MSAPGPTETGVGLRHLLSTEGLGRAQAEALLDTAAGMEQALTGRAVRKLPTLRGRTVVNLFFEDSTRTRISFEAAAKRLRAAQDEARAREEAEREEAAVAQDAAAKAEQAKATAAGLKRQFAAQKIVTAALVGPDKPVSTASR